MDSDVQHRACFRSLLDADDVVADFVDFTAVGCDLGLVLAGDDSKFTMNAIGLSAITLSDKKRLEMLTSGAADSVVVRDTDCIDNAGFENSSAPIGGVAIHSNATIDLGNNGTSDKGLNRLCCNRNGGDTLNQQIHNQSGGLINANGNYWCGVTPAVTNGAGSTTSNADAQTDATMVCTSR